MTSLHCREVIESQLRVGSQNFSRSWEMIFSNSENRQYVYQAVCTLVIRWLMFDYLQSASPHTTLCDVMCSAPCGNYKGKLEV